MMWGSPDANKGGLSAEAEQRVTLRLHEDVLDALDRWIASRPEPRPSREDAIRDILAAGLRRKSVVDLERR